MDLFDNDLIFEHLSSYLSVKDVLNCNLVCKTWYTRFNQDFIWKRFCKREPIEPEEYDWDINATQWILDIPCDWRRYFLNYKRTAYNIKNKIYKTYEFKGIAITPVAYDGKTFVTKDKSATKIYKMNDCNLEYFGTLSDSISVTDNHYDSLIFTNSTYIIVKVRRTVYVYALRGDAYEFNHLLLEDSKSNDITCASEQISREELLEIIESNREPLMHSASYFDECSLFGNKLIVRIKRLKESNPDTTYIWDLDERKQLLKVDDLTHYANDNKSVYLYKRETGKITAINENCETIFSVDVDFHISNLYVNNQLLIVLQSYVSNGTNCSVKLSAWDKRSGRLEVHRILETQGSSISFHPTYNMMFYAFEDAYDRFPKLEAYSINNHLKLWEISGSFQSNLAMFYILFKELPGTVFVKQVEELFEDDDDIIINKEIAVYDVKTGNYCYSIEDVALYDDCMFGFKDIISVSNDSDMSGIAVKLTVNLYR